MKVESESQVQVHGNETHQLMKDFVDWADKEWDTHYEPAPYPGWVWQAHPRTLHSVNQAIWRCPANIIFRHYVLVFDHKPSMAELMSSFVPDVNRIHDAWRGHGPGINCYAVYYPSRRGWRGVVLDTVENVQLREIQLKVEE